jgi:hypothetical protein
LGEKEKTENVSEKRRKGKLTVKHKKLSKKGIT